MIEGAPFPAIEKVYDPSSKKCNGRAALITGTMKRLLP